MNTLLLNAGGMPAEIVPWQSAVQLLLGGDVALESSYAEFRVRSMAIDMPRPAIVRDPRRYGRLGLNATRGNVFARDRFACQYCGIAPCRSGGRPDVERLTIDHVVPRARSEHGYVLGFANGRAIALNDWENLTTACGPCNHRKANRTPTEAGLSLRCVPTHPGFLDSIRILFSRVRTLPSAWEPYLSL